MNSLNVQKLEMWRQKLTDLEKELAKTMELKGLAAREGDLSENAAYKEYIEKSEMLSAQLASVQKVIKELQNEKKT